MKYFHENVNQVNFLKLLLGISVNNMETAINSDLYYFSLPVT